MVPMPADRSRPFAPKSSYKSELGRFLAENPFSQPLTLGFFYREKMRAIHVVSPDCPFNSVLEVGGGKGGLTTLLYPNAHITNIDLDGSHAQAPCNQQPNVDFIEGNATELPFPDSSFGAVTMFDVLEHIPDDRLAVAEAIRVLKPKGYILVSTPDRSNWRFPYYQVFKRICPSETSVMAEWGHVRRGYTLAELHRLLKLPCRKSATFINCITVINHDIAFSRLPKLLRVGLLYLLAPVAWSAYWLHRPSSQGTETASSWQKP